MPAPLRISVTVRNWRGAGRARRPEGETYTLHSPKNFMAATATQVNFEIRELYAINRCPSNSRMNERYGQSASANKLPLRNVIIQMMVGGWRSADSLILPETSPWSERVSRNPVTQSTGMSTQLSADTDPPPTPRRRHFECPSHRYTLCGARVIESTQAEEVGNPV